MRLLRWAGDHVASADGTRQEIGVATLEALVTSEMLQPEDYDLVDAITDVMLGPGLGAYDDEEGSPRAGGE